MNVNFTWSQSSFLRSWPAEDGLPERSKSFIVSKGGNKSAVFMSKPFQSFVAHGWCVALLMLWVVPKHKEVSELVSVANILSTPSLWVFLLSNQIWTNAWGGEEEAGGRHTRRGAGRQQTRWLRPEDFSQTSQYSLPEEPQYDQEESPQHLDGQNQQHLSMFLSFSRAWLYAKLSYVNFSLRPFSL